MSWPRRFQCSLLLWGLMIGGCGEGIEGYRQTVKYASVAIPSAVEMEKVFGDVDQFIEQYGLKSPNANRWDTEAYFGDRYVLTMQAPIAIDYKIHKFKVTGKLYFQINEVKRVIIDSDGVVMTYYGEQFVFSEEEWKRVYESQGDFSKIGIKLNPAPVKDFDKCQRAMSGPRIPRISLLKNQ